MGARAVSAATGCDDDGDFGSERYPANVTVSIQDLSDDGIPKLYMGVPISTTSAVCSSASNGADTAQAARCSGLNGAAASRAKSEMPFLPVRRRCVQVLAAARAHPAARREGARPGCAGRHRAGAYLTRCLQPPAAPARAGIRAHRRNPRQTCAPSPRPGPVGRGCNGAGCGSQPAQPATRGLAFHRGHQPGQEHTYRRRGPCRTSGNDSSAHPDTNARPGASFISHRHMISRTGLCSSRRVCRCLPRGSDRIAT